MENCPKWLMELSRWTRGEDEYLAQMYDMRRRGYSNYIPQRVKYNQLSLDDIEMLVNSAEFQRDPLLQKHLQNYILEKYVYPSQWHW